MKLSKRLLEIVEERQKAAEFAARISARIDEGDQTLPSMYRERTSDYYDGLKEAHEGAIESLLMAYNAYNGFQSKICDKHGAYWNEYNLSKAKGVES